jgi:hypothetical protein
MWSGNNQKQESFVGFDQTFFDQAIAVDVAFVRPATRKWKIMRSMQGTI